MTTGVPDLSQAATAVETDPLWAGRFSGAVDAAFKRFNDSLPFDRRLVPEDVQGSAAWARALERAGVLDASERQAIEAALTDIIRTLRSDPALIEAASDEDVHSWVERQLIERVGDLGKRLHTGRSRNDQVATDFRLWTMQAIDERVTQLRALVDTLTELAGRERDTVFPGYTHLQRAQPILFAHWCLAYVDMLRRDVDRLRDARKRVAVCPLGSAALAGTAWPIDRAALAADLGFSAVSTNSLDAVSDRDFVIETLAALSTAAMHLSRLAEDLIFYCSGEARLIELPDALCSGSSIMPQKKNPDALELIRGKAGRQMGHLLSVLVMLKGLPLAYNKDMQEDKRPLFEAMDDFAACLDVLPPLLAGLVINREQARDAALGDYSNATELADHLVAQGVPFREAHHQTGQIVRDAIESRQPIEALSLSAIHRHAPKATREVFVALTVEAALAKRDVAGGTAPARVAGRLSRLKRPSPARTRTAVDVHLRAATVDDLPGIMRLIEHWAEAGENLPRDEQEVLHAISDFVVAVDRGAPDPGHVIGCGALWLYDPNLAEIRTVGVDPDVHGAGIGSKMIEYLVQAAAELHVDQVFVLTRAPRFFDRLQFRSVTINSLPEKILKDCAICPKKTCCDEVAMIRPTRSTTAAGLPS